MQAQLLKHKDKEEYFVAIPERFWCDYLDERTNLDSLVESTEVPPQTQFTKLPSFQTATTKQEMIEALRCQKEYWEGEACAEIAKDWNGEGGNAERHKRYKMRVEACRDFLVALQETPLPDDNAGYC